MFAKHRAAKAAEEAAVARAEMGRMLSVAEGRDHPAATIVLKPGEECVHAINGAGLFETRRGPGHWQGRSSGISVPVGGGVRIRTGASRGHYVQGSEAPTIIDTGTVTITSRRVVFTGPRYTREWDFGKLVGIEHFQDQPWTAIQVSNRQKTSGFTYKGLRPDFVHAWLDIALAINGGHRDQAAEQLRAQLGVLDPAPAAPDPAALAPAAAVAGAQASVVSEGPGAGVAEAPAAVVVEGPGAGVAEAPAVSESPAAGVAEAPGAGVAEAPTAAVVAEGPGTVVSEAPSAAGPGGTATGAAPAAAVVEVPAAAAAAVMAEGAAAAGPGAPATGGASAAGGAPAAAVAEAPAAAGPGGPGAPAGVAGAAAGAESPAAGRPDGGRPEGGHPDAGRPDTGRPDAGHPDGGRPLPPPNWYPDPAGLAPLRWWDGTQWTSYTAGVPGGAQR